MNQGIPNKVFTDNVDPLDDQIRTHFLAANSLLRAIVAGQRRLMPIDTLSTKAPFITSLFLVRAPNNVTCYEEYFAIFSPIAEDSLIDALAEDEPITFEEHDMVGVPAIDSTLKSMCAEHAGRLQVDEMRFIAGFENQEIADLRGVTEITVRRDSSQACAILTETTDDN